MLRYLKDPANAITACGLLFSAMSLSVAISGNLALAVAIALWAWLADQVDGIVARRTAPRRGPSVAHLGKCLDGYADVIHGLIIPSVVLLLIQPGAAHTAVATGLLVLMGCLRLAYFDAFGLDAGLYRGVPVSYNLPLLALIFLLRGTLGQVYLPAVASTSFVVLALLHISPIQVPAIRGVAYPITMTAAILTSITLAAV